MALVWAAHRAPDLRARAGGLTLHTSEVRWGSQLESQTSCVRSPGPSNREIAQTEFLSINSVKTYIRSTYRKMRVGNPAGPWLGLSSKDLRRASLSPARAPRGSRCPRCGTGVPLTPESVWAVVCGSAACTFHLWRIDRFCDFLGVRHPDPVSAASLARREMA